MLEVHPFTECIRTADHHRQRKGKGLETDCTSDMQGMLWGEPKLSHVWVFDHMVFFTVIMLLNEV